MNHSGKTYGEGHLGTCTVGSRDNTKRVSICRTSAAAAARAAAAASLQSSCCPKYTTDAVSLHTVVTAASTAPLIVNCISMHVHPSYALSLPSPLCSCHRLPASAKPKCMLICTRPLIPTSDCTTACCAHLLYNCTPTQPSWTANWAHMQGGRCKQSPASNGPTARPYSPARAGKTISLAVYQPSRHNKLPPLQRCTCGEGALAGPLTSSQHCLEWPNCSHEADRHNGHNL